ncbi:sensor histidine kinase [Butyrivibrio proteoclasticus]|uniref:sensor histidine kinase n=1 Tax=Butyrivibrio proteoclasticus TaxID=43305 RepID=UPI00047C07A6|nr:histidine kinase [Butyrivibrio proteoclasticus]
MGKHWGLSKIKRELFGDKLGLSSLQRSLFLIFMASWIIPIIVLSAFIFIQYQQAYANRTEREMAGQAKVSGVLVKSKIDDAISKLYKVSTGGEWERKSRRDNFIVWARSELNRKFYMDGQFSCVALYVEDDTSPSAYIGKNGYEYETYVGEVEPIVLEDLDKKEKMTRIVVTDNKIYLVQNLFYTTYDRRYATIVAGLDVDKLLADIPVGPANEVYISFNQEKELISYQNTEEELKGNKKNVLDYLMAGNDVYRGKFYYILLNGNYYDGCRYAATGRNYEMQLFYLENVKDLYFEISRINIIVFITIIGMMPIMLLSYYYMKKNTEYTQRMMTKDAQIAALQAQINPHFLNNTLEMMNWQARMAGDMETSKMIEALGTVLDSGINRDNDKLVRLADELRCGDAFLYIMSMRFGERLKVEKIIDSSTLGTYVPQLILQPILENAIKHGVESISRGTVWLNIFEEKDDLIIDVINTGKEVSDEEVDRIRKIISGEMKLNRGEPGTHTSIGIYNVNKRIELIFGEDYGLSVNKDGENKMQFRMVMPISKGE